MNRRVIVILIVAFVLGAGGGAVAEHLRLKHASDKPGASATTPSTAPRNSTAAGAADWFAAKATQACPALKTWNASGAATAKAIAKKGAWTATRTALVAAIKATGAAYVALEPFANTAGKTELQFLKARQDEVSSAIGKTSSLAAYVQAQTKLKSTRAQRDVLILSRAAQSCTA